MSRLGLPLVPAPFRWAIVVAVALVIFANSIVFVPPTPPGAEPGPFWDKRLHFAAYATLTLSLAYATARSDLEPPTRLMGVLFFAMGYGIAIELLQAPLPDRFFSYADLLANALGAVLGLVYFAIENRLSYMPVGWRS